MAVHVKELLRLLGEDVDREGLVKTPMRVAKALQFLTSGSRQDLDTVINEAVFNEDHDEMVIVRNIDLFSLCEHHMLPFMGKAHIAYLPQKKVIGLSKLGRITDLYARRLQVQERLTSQVANTLMKVISPRGVGVVIEATHMCMSMRGVQKTTATTITSSMLGAFRDDPQTRGEFLSLLGMPGLQGHTSGISHPSESTSYPREVKQPPPAPVKRLLPPDESGVSGVSVPPGEAPLSTIALFKEDMKFSAGHFTIFGSSSRERLHGHNYTVALEFQAPVAPESGMVVDYNVYKARARALCAEYDEFLLLPGHSPHLSITELPGSASASPSVQVVFGPEHTPKDIFSMPQADVLVLPVANITLESLSQLFVDRLVEEFGPQMQQHKVRQLAVQVSSGPGQSAEHRRYLQY